MAYRLIRNIYNSNIANVSFNILYYFGNDSMYSVFSELNHRPTKQNIEYCKAIQTLNSFAKRNNINYQKKTNISYIFSFISDNIGYYGENKEFDDFLNIVLISDFEHEETSGVSFQELDFLIDNSFTKINCDKLSLVKISNRSPQKLQYEQTIDIIQSNGFNSLLYCFDEFIIHDKVESYYSFVNAIGSLSILDNKHPIELYYPSNEFEYSALAVGSVKVNYSKKFNDIIMTFENRDNPILEKSLQLKLNSHYILNVNHPRCIDLNELSSNLIELSSSVNKVVNNNLFLSVSTPNDLVTRRYPILIREKLPLNTLYLLCFLLLIVLYLFSINSCFYIITAFKSLKASSNYFSPSIKTNHFILLLFLIIQVFITILIAFYFIKMSVQLVFLPLYLLFIFLICLAYFIAFVKPGYYFLYHPKIAH